MPNKKIIMLSVLIVLLLAVSAVSATENVTDDIVGIENQDNNAITEELTSNIDKNILNANANTFTELNSVINDNSNADIYLNCNYTYNPDSDSSFEDGIDFNRDVTIHGNGFTINGDETARIFKVTQGNVVFQDIVFVNGCGFRGGAIYGKCTAVNCTFIGNSVSNNGDGGAVYGKCTAVNCNFRDNHAYQGGAMSGGSATGCTFINNSASNFGGGALSGGSATGCTFINNSARYGGALSGGSATGCTFINNSAWDYGGAFSGKGSSAVNCTFINNSALDYGGAMSYVSAVNCIFINNFARNYGGAMYDGSATGCTFINNSAINYGGGAIFSGSAVNSTFVNNDIVGVDTMNCTFIPAPTVITVTDLVTVYGVSKKLIISLADIAGNVLSGAQITVLLNNKSYKEFTDSDGEVSIDVPNNLNPNTYTATISYIGDNEYLPSETTANIVVNKATADISCDDISTIYNDDGELVATLTNAATGKAIADVEVIINLKGVDTTVKTDSQGQAKLSTNGLVPGEYTATISYAGNADYEPSSATANVVVNKADVNIFAPGINVVYKDENNAVIATIENEYGKVLNGANVVVNINGVNYAVKSNSKGQIKVPTDSLAMKNYTATISYAGNAKYNPTNVTTYVVVKANTCIIAPDAYVTYKDENGTLVATLTNAATGRGISGVTLVVNLNGVDYRVKTDSNGQIRVSTDNLTTKTYTATISFGGTNKYNPTNTTAKVIVNKADVVIIADDVNVVYKDETGELTANLTNVYGTALKGANVVVSINGEDYALKTDSNGQVKVSTASLTPGTYTATISYAGNTKYNPTNTMVSVVVYKAATSISAIDNGEELVATLTNEYGKTLVSANVVVNLNGVDYALKTNSKGQVKLSTSGLDPKVYTATISYAGNAKYNSASTTIKAAEGKTITCLSTVYDDETDEVVATLINSATGNGIKGAKVTINIDGVKTSQFTDSNGQVRVSAEGLTPNSYVVTGSYAGNSKYTATSTIGTIFITN